MNVTIRFIEHDEYMKVAPNSYSRGFVRLVVEQTEIVVCKDHYDLELIAHEIGHILGRKHTILPFIMNPSGAFRLSNIPSTIIKIIRHMW